MSGSAAATTTKRATSIRKRGSSGRDAATTSSHSFPTTSPSSKCTPVRSTPGAWADRHGILLLLMLYTAQGLPMGLIFGSIPFLLKSTVSYADLGLFSFSSLPYALKLLVAPLIDGGRPLLPIGRRPGWIVPPLAAAGFLLFFLADTIDTWVTQGRVYILTPLCFSIIAFTAIQDVAVDGWSLELLSEENVAYASVCQSLGTSLGFLATFTVFLAFSDASFCAKYLWPTLSPASTGAAVSLVGAIRATALTFLSVSLAVVLYAFSSPAKKSSSFLSSAVSGTEEETSAFDVRPTGFLVDQEASQKISKQEAEAENDDVENVADSYWTLYKLLKLRPVQELVLVLLLAKAGFSAFDSTVSLKLIDFGFPKETIAFVAVIQAPIQLMGTLVVGRWAAQGSPHRPYMAGYLMRFLLSLSGPILVNTFAQMNGVLTNTFYATFVAISILYGIAADCLMFVSIGAFFLRITSSSQKIGGTYLTLLYAAQNMGGMWPKSVTLFLVEKLTVYEKCAAEENICPVKIDGFYLISVILACFAAFVGLHAHRTMRKLAKIPVDNWKPLAHH